MKPGLKPDAGNGRLRKGKKMAAEKTQAEFRAEARFQRISPQKARLVLNLIKGLDAQQALDTLSFTRKRIAPVVRKVLTSAIDNARYLSDDRGLDLDVDRLFVKTAIANEGPRMKRIRPAPMGRAFHYQRRLTHIIVTVAERAAEQPKPAGKAAKKAKTAA